VSAHWPEKSDVRVNNAIVLGPDLAPTCFAPKPCALRSIAVCRDQSKIACGNPEALQNCRIEAFVRFLRKWCEGGGIDMPTRKHE